MTPRGKSTGRGWPIAVVVVLTLVVLLNVWVAFIANDDPSFAIEPNYYAKAVAWDSTLAQQRRNAALGWTLTSTLDAFARGAGATLHVRLIDSAGKPIPAATIGVSALYNARAATVYTATMRADGDGYVTTLPVAHAGQWEFRFDVVRGGERFTSDVRIDAVPSGTQ